MTIGAEGLDAEAAQLFAVSANQRLVAQIVEAEQVAWQSAIDAGSGSLDHHRAELKLLGEMGERVRFLVGVYEIREPIDTEFVMEVIDFLRASDYDRSWSETRHSRETELSHLSQAVQNLQMRHAAEPTAAADLSL